MAAAMRFLSLVLIVIALMLLGADVLTSLEKGGEITVRSLDQVWLIVNKTSDIEFKAWMARTLPSMLAGLIQTILGFWSWAVFGLPGVVLAFLFGRRVADV
jgi:hypothetical protein